MANFSSAEALTRYLDASPQPARGDRIERLVEPLVAEAATGMPLAKLFALSGQTRPDFLDTLGSALSGQIIEKFEGPDGGEWVRASKGALSLF